MATFFSSDWLTEAGNFGSLAANVNILMWFCLSEVNSRFDMEKIHSLILEFNLRLEREYLEFLAFTWIGPITCIMFS